MDLDKERAVITPDQIRHKNADHLNFEQLAAAVAHIDGQLKLRHSKAAYEQFTTILPFSPTAEAMRKIEREYSPAWNVELELGSFNNCYVTLTPKTDGSK